MIPTVTKLCEDVSRIVADPIAEAKKMAITEGAEAVAAASIKAMTPINKHISRYKNMNVTNNDELVVVTVLAKMLYDRLLGMTINGVSVRKLRGDSDSFPLSFFLKEVVVKADVDLHGTVKETLNKVLIYSTQSATIKRSG